jgi:hypothetical protein
MQAPKQALVSPRAKLSVTIVLFTSLGAAACTDRRVPVETESTSTTMVSSTSQAATDTQIGSMGETSSVPAGWPQDWYGDYYEDPELTFGYENPVPYLNIHGFRNARLEEGTVKFERFTQVLGDDEQEATFATELDGGVLRVLPPNDEWDIPYFYSGADEVFFRPGAGCGELVLEVHGPEPLYEPFWSTQWWRGWICLTNPHDTTIDWDRWAVDLCPGSVSSCDGG